MVSTTALEWILLPFYLIVVYVLLMLWARRRYTGKMLRYFNLGLAAKLMGAVVYVIYHTYIYGGGDMFFYFDVAKDVNAFFFTDPARFFKLLFLPVQSTMDIFPEVADRNIYIESNYFVSRIAIIVNLFTFSRILLSTVLFSALSYFGIWYAFRSCCKVWPHITKEMALIFLFIPSIVLWASGLAKDSLTYGGICMVLGATIRLFVAKDGKPIRNFLYLLIGAYVVFKIKSYILFPFIICFGLGLVLRRFYNIEQRAVKMIVFPVFIITMLLISAIVFQVLNSSEEFQLDLIADRVVTLNRYLSDSEKAGSTYDLGIDYTADVSFGALLPFFPISIITTLFRPFVWEVRNPAMLLAALENIILLIYFIITLFKRKFFGVIKTTLKQPLIMSCLLYTLIFAALVGITSGNFGTLVRYKIPCLPFFCIFIFYCNKDVKPALKKAKQIIIPAASSAGKV